MNCAKASRETSKRLSMKNSQHSDESNFSYNWSLNTKFDSMEYEEEEAAFIDMDPSLSLSKRFSNVNQHDNFINFNFPTSDNKEKEEYSIMKNNIAQPNSSTLNSDTNSSARSSGILEKLLKFLKPLCQKISFGTSCKSSKSTRVVEGPMLMKKYWESSEGTSLTPRTSIANYSEDDWRRSCDSEASIYEAVLHCKRTINGDE